MRTIRPAAALALAVLLLAGAGCGRSFRPQRYDVGPPLFSESLSRFEREKWGDAVAGFERLTLELPARDPLLPQAFFYLGRAHEERDEWLLAAQSYTRLATTFPSDSLADDALYRAGEAYGQLWPKPELDPTYGESALDMFRLLLSEYPDSPLADEARQAVIEVQERQAQKDLRTGIFYIRRRAYDSAILYFLDVVARYPETDAARQASLRLIDAYGRIDYGEEIRALCETLRQRYPEDGEVRDACGPAPEGGTAAPPPSPADAA